MTYSYEDHPVIVAIRIEELKELERQKIEAAKADVRAVRKTNTYKLLKRLSNLWRKIHG